MHARFAKFCGIPAAKGFITPTSIPIFLKVTAKPAVKYVLPTSVSDPVTNNDFMNNYGNFLLINFSLLFTGLNYDSLKSKELKIKLEHKGICIKKIHLV